MRTPGSYDPMAAAPITGSARPACVRIAAPVVAPSPVVPSDPGREMP